MIPEGFKNRMKSLLGNEYPAFIYALEEEKAVKAVRINTLKTETEEFISKTALKLSEIPYTREGFILEESTGIGQAPEHHSGQIYVQDPGAMATLTALDIKEGWRVMDMCSAPGGKSGQAASKIGDVGFIHSNEFVPKRAKITVANYERLGIKNGIITSLDTKELPKLYSDFFDLVIADVPCSGEGMFRKSSEATEEWSEQNVTACAERQWEILKNAPPILKSGGYILYSTCTYSLEENEMIIDRFLSEYPDFSLVPVKKELRDATSDGIVFQGASHTNLHLTRRFYPHISKGEGQFIALLKKQEGTDKKQTILYKDVTRQLNREELSAVKNFFEGNLSNPPCGEVRKYGENIVLISHGIPIPPHSVFSAGVLIGTVEKGNLFPSHQFFSAYGNLFKRKEFLTRGDPRAEKYLHGEEIDAQSFPQSGWCAVIYEGSALGGGKMSGGRIKNHYPKGLRNK